MTTAAHAYLVFLLAMVAIATIPLVFGWHGSVVQGGSMEPKISIGDVVLSTDLSGNSPVPLGGVVEFDRDRPNGPGTMSVLHRVVQDNRDGTYTTAGDANAEVDSTSLIREKITGQARILVPYVGLPGFWINTGNLSPLILWSAMTVLAIIVSTLAVTPRKHHTREQGSDRDNGPGEPEAKEVVLQSGDTGRRAFLAVTAISIGAGALAFPQAGTNAVFIGKTSNAKNSWSVKTLTSLTLGRATPYALFAGESVVNDGSYFATYITGSAGTSPGTDIERFAFWQVSGSQDRNNQVARNAKADLKILYKSIDSRKPTTTLESKLSGSVGPGTHKSRRDDFTIENTLTLDGRGDPNAVFIFKAEDITAARNSYIRLTNGALANNVFWRATGNITLERNSVASGNFLADDEAEMESAADLTGRLMSLENSVTVTGATARLPR